MGAEGLLSMVLEGLHHVYDPLGPGFRPLAQAVFLHLFRPAEDAEHRLVVDMDGLGVLGGDQRLQLLPDRAGVAGLAAPYLRNRRWI